MEHSKKWFDFTCIAQNELLKGHATDSYRPNIQIAIEPSFENSILLQLVIYDETVLWYRTTWLKQVDALKFSDPIESLKYIGETIHPTITFENGTIPKQTINNIIETVQTISIRPVLDKLGGFVLDGTTYTLTIGADGANTLYKWNYLLDRWSELQRVADLLEELNDTLT